MLNVTQRERRLHDDHSTWQAKRIATPTRGDNDSSMMYGGCLDFLSPLAGTGPRGCQERIAELCKCKPHKEGTACLAWIPPLSCIPRHERHSLQPGANSTNIFSLSLSGPTRRREYPNVQMTAVALQCCQEDFTTAIRTCIMSDHPFLPVVHYPL